MRISHHWILGSAQKKGVAGLHTHYCSIETGLEDFDSHMQLEKMEIDLVGGTLGACRTDPIGKNRRDRHRGCFRTSKGRHRERLFVSQFIARHSRFSSLCRAWNACPSRDQFGTAHIGIRAKTPALARTDKEAHRPLRTHHS